MPDKKDGGQGEQGDKKSTKTGLTNVEFENIDFGGAGNGDKDKNKNKNKGKGGSSKN